MGKFKRKKKANKPQKIEKLLSPKFEMDEGIENMKFKYLNRLCPFFIQEEKLLYNEKTLKQASELATFLERENFRKIVDRALKKRPNLPFIVLLHGPSGTGKTALVRDICKRTGRYMLEVRVERLRNTDLGEDEKVLTKMFEEYATAVAVCREYPIMFFDECEGHLYSRMNIDSHNPGLVNHLNNMTTIWLKQFQDLHGILFLTTNRKEDLDDAFARRILYQVEVDYPDKETQAEIWANLFPKVLTPEQCKSLAEETNFTGGQIKQVQTKADIHELLYGKITFETIRDICETNGKTTTERKAIGFKC